MADAFWDNVVLALQADDQAHGSTTFRDLSLYARPVTAAGSASITTSTVLSGLGSFNLNAAAGTATARIECASSSQFNPAANSNWVIEGKFSLTSLGGVYTSPNFCTLRADANNRMGLIFRPGSPGTLSVFSTVAGSTTQRNYTTSLSTGHTYDFAWVNDGGNVYLYVDGTRVISSTLTYANASMSLAIGSDNGGGNYMAGYADDIRITMGASRYTGASYTPLTIPFPIHLQVTGFSPFHADAVSPVSFSFPVTGFKPISVGAPLLMFDAFPEVTGFAPVHFGTPESRSVFKVRSLGRVIRFGVPSVLNPPLKVSTLGRVTRFGIPRVAATGRPVEVATLGCVTRFGTPAVPSSRTFAVSGFAPVKFGYPVSLNYLPH